MPQPRRREKLAGGTSAKEHAMSEKLNSAVAVIGIDDPNGPVEVCPVTRSHAR